MGAQPAPPEHILIVGGGSAGWMTASIFLNSLGKAGSRISLVESANIPTIGVGEGTTPLFRRFLNFLGIAEAEFMSRCRATYKLGIDFPGWTGNGDFYRYFHPFAAPGYNHYERAFFNNCDRRRAGEPASTDPGDFFFNAELATQNRAPVGPPPCDAGRMDYAYHFDTALVAEFLKQRCLDQGIHYIVDDVTGVAIHGNGDIRHIVTAERGPLAADFFVDCTGFRRLLIGGTLNTERISYQPRLFNDRAVVIRTPEPLGPGIPPYTRSTALRCGWAWRIPLVGKTSWGYVYSGDYTGEDEAETELRAHIGTASRGIDPLHIRLQTGRGVAHWKKNCLAIGLSQGFIEPLEATALALTQFSINRFVTHFARGDYLPTHRDLFNEIINEAFDRTIDYIQLHYKLNTRGDTPYWQDCRANKHITTTMEAIIRGWDDPGEDFIDVLRRHVHRSSYAPYSWYCILSGMGRYGSHAVSPRSGNATNPYRDEVSRYYRHGDYLRGLQAGAGPGYQAFSPGNQ